MDKNVILVGVFSILLLLVFSFVFSRDLSAEVTLPGVPTEAGQSVAYYLKVLNAQVVSGVTNEVFSKEAVDKANSTVSLTDKEKEKVATTTNTSNSPRKINSITWTDLREESGRATIVFDKVACGADPAKQLTVAYEGQQFTAWNYVYTFVDSQAVKCNYGIQTVGNLFTKTNGLVFGAIVRSGTCSYTTCNLDVLNAKIQSKGSSYELILESPLIPEACNGKTVSQANATNGVLKLTC